ncbi:MAG: M14 family metallopeptidase, partial [Anaerolineales bacterium]
EGRASRAIKIARGTGGHRHGVLFLGGVHARELVNPDLLVSLALNLCRAFTANTGLTFGGKTYSAETIQLLVRGMDTFIFPLVNPDGRVHVQKDPSLGGDSWWRKNRRVNAGSSCLGADLNRNYDFLWSANLNASSNPCDYQSYKGPSAFSEPETRNVRHLLETYPNIECVIDVHSYSEVILHPWGDDENQFTNTSMNFMNPAYNGLRGTVGDTRYKEHIRSADHNWLVDAANDMRDAIAAVRGRTYTVMQSALLYNSGVSGSSKDYAFSRHLADGSKSKVYAYTLETGTEFQPPYSEALNIISEVSASLIRFCLSCQCAVEEMVSGTELVKALEDWRAFRDNEMRRTAAGRNYIRLLERHSVELLQIAMREQRLREQAVDLLRRVDAVVRSRHDPKPQT